MNSMLSLTAGLMKNMKQEEEKHQGEDQLEEYIQVASEENLPENWNVWRRKCGTKLVDAFCS